MIYLFKAAFPTLGIMLYEIFYLKQRRNSLFYIILFSLFCLFNYAFDNYLYSKEHYVYECKLTPHQRNHYWNLIHEHYYQAYRCSHEADSWCDIIPRKVDKVASKAMIAAVTSGIMSRNITSTGIATATVVVQDLIEDLKGIWDNVKSNLNAAKYHIEMAEFYQDVLASDGG